MTHHPIYKATFVVICLAAVYNQFNYVTSTYVIIVSLLVLFLFFELSRFDRNVTLLTFREFEYYYLLFNIVELNFGAAVLQYRNKADNASIVSYCVFNIVIFLFIFALDAAPTYPRVLKVVAVFCCLLVLLRFVVGYTFFTPFESALDTPICVVIKCFSPRVIMTNGGGNIAVFLIRILWHMRIKGMLALPQTRLKFEISYPKKEMAPERMMEELEFGTLRDLSSPNPNSPKGGVARINQQEAAILNNLNGGTSVGHDHSSSIDTTADTDETRDYVL